MSQSTNHYLKLIILVIATFLARLLPHPANVNPITPLCLFLGHSLPFWHGLGILLPLNLLCDFILSSLHGYPFIGSWTIFTYSAWAGIMLVGNKANLKSSKTMPLGIIFFSLLFWLWTNFGVWLFSGMYAHNLESFIKCYSLALPFLKMSIFGDLFWASIIFGFHLKAHKSIQREPLRYSYKNVY